MFAALKVNPARIDSYCQAVDEPILEEIRKLPSGASMDQLKDRWYQGRDGSDYHYHSSRYRACNMHSVFYHGTIEWRLFNSTLHAGEAKANIILAMAISAQGINQKYTQFQKTPIGDSWVYVRQYCVEIDEAARNRMELIVPKLAKQYGVTEQLKADNQMEWVRQMNACKAQAEEIVKAELIYD